MATYSALDVAAEIRKRLPGVAAKKLHKLLYYSQAHHLIAFNRPLFRESISAWDMGPVVGQLWWMEKQQGVRSAPADAVLNEAALNTVGYVVSRYGKLSGLDLERLTHNEEPWLDADRARQDLGEKSQKITVEAITEFFRDEASREESADQPLNPDEVDVALRGAADRRYDRDNFDTVESLLARLR